MSRLAGVPGVGALPPALGGMAAGGLPVPGMPGTPVTFCLEVKRAPAVPVLVRTRPERWAHDRACCIALLRTAALRGASGRERAGALPGPPAMVPAGTVVLQAGAQALALEQGVLGPASPIPTQCLLLKNMFNPAECAPARAPLHASGLMHLVMQHMSAAFTG